MNTQSIAESDFFSQARSLPLNFDLDQTYGIEIVTDLFIQLFSNKNLSF